jgi:hypothetical protein
MSLNRYEQALHTYVETHPDELRHWQGKVREALKLRPAVGEGVRALERELWDYFAERSEHVPALRALHAGGIRRVSLLNLAEYLCRIWGPPVPPKRPPLRS